VKHKLNVRIVILVVMALMTLFIGVGYAGVYNRPGLATYLAFGSSFATFLVLLDTKLDRVMKGCFLIAIGPLYQLVYPKYFYFFVDRSLMTFDLTGQFEIYGQVILLACAGAGGSIIAAYADKTTNDYEPAASANVKTVIEQTVIDNTRHIEYLTALAEKSTKQISVLTMAILILTIATVVNFWIK
jgi:hypothetical protein